MGGYEWEVLFASGRRFRLPAKEFSAESYSAVVPAPSALAEPKVRIPLDIDQFRARQTLEALRLGIVPVQDAETLTIGLEAERVTLDRALDRSRERSGDVLAVIGDYGFGKSHFIELAARRALRENFLVAGASLDLVETPPGKAHKIYEALVTALRYPDTQRRGLLPLIEKVLARPALIAEFARLCPREVKDCPLAAALTALEECPSQAALDETVTWLSGQTKVGAEMKTLLQTPAAALHHRRECAPVQLPAYRHQPAGHAGRLQRACGAHRRVRALFAAARSAARARRFLFQGDDRECAGAQQRAHRPA